VPTPRGSPTIISPGGEADVDNRLQDGTTRGPELPTTNITLCRGEIKAWMELGGVESGVKAGGQRKSKFSRRNMKLFLCDDIEF
jgi:hypothetical protein